MRKRFEGETNLVRFSRRFELSKVRVIESLKHHRMTALRITLFTVVSHSFCPTTIVSTLSISVFASCCIMFSETIFKFLSLISIKFDDILKFLIKQLFF